MKIKLTLLTVLMIVAFGVKAQNLITVQHAGVPTFYAKLPDAINGALAGDTVLIPGGSFDAITISKKLYLIGVGANPDSTKASGRTTISSIRFGGIDGGSMTGIYSLVATVFNSSISNYTIYRCKIDQLTLSQASNVVSNITIYECIIGSLNMNGYNHTISNNIFTNQMYIDASSVIENNLSLFQSSSAPLYTNNSRVENNIMVQYNINGFFLGSNNIFNNNINVAVNGVWGNSNNGANNFYNIDLKSIFPAYDPTVNYDANDLIYKVLFSLDPASPYKNAGTDGTDIGIHGGMFPWKIGSLPPNPHFQSINIAPQTDASGNLKVQITVAAQDH